MRDFFKHLTLKKVGTILGVSIVLFLGSIWLSYLFQQVTNSSLFLPSSVFSDSGGYVTSRIQIHDQAIHLHTIGDTSKPQLMILTGRGSGIFKRRYMLTQTDILDNYSLTFVDQTKLSRKVNNKDIAQALETHLEKMGIPIHLIATSGGTFTALHVLDINQDLISKAILIGGRYNTLIDTTQDSEKDIMKYTSRIMPPNFMKAWNERQDIETNINPLLQGLSAKIDTPVLIVHGTYNLSLNSSHATYLEEVLRIPNSTFLTDTKQLRLKKHSKLIYGAIDGFLEE